MPVDKITISKLLEVLQEVMDTEGDLKVVLGDEQFKADMVSCSVVESRAGRVLLLI